jgi:hypothetical protein
MLGNGRIGPVLGDRCGRAWAICRPESRENCAGNPCEPGRPAL